MGERDPRDRNDSGSFCGFCVGSFLVWCMVYVELERSEMEGNVVKVGGKKT